MFGCHVNYLFTVTRNLDGSIVRVTFYPMMEQDSSPRQFHRNLMKEKINATG